jgi:hypothetical protein
MIVTNESDIEKRANALTCIIMHYHLIVLVYIRNKILVGESFALVNLSMVLISEYSFNLPSVLILL